MDSSFFKTSILTIIEQERLQRLNRQNKIIILGLMESNDDFVEIKKIFKLLNQKPPHFFQRMVKNDRNSKYQRPFICNLESLYHVKQIH